MPSLSGYRLMWLIVLFDLPTESKKDRRNYAQFRKQLLKAGFTCMQWSVYVRHCASRESANAQSAAVRRHLPPAGEVRIFRLTDRQYEAMEVFWGTARKPPEQPPQQLEFF